MSRACLYEGARRAILNCDLRGGTMWRSTMWGVCVGVVLALAATSDAEDKPTQPAPIRAEANDWPWWRGPSRNGIAPSGQKAPTKWSATEGIRWKTPVPGKGHGSPIVVGNQVILNSAITDPDHQVVISFDRETGKELWRTTVHEGGFVAKQNDKSTSSNSTPACDGERVFVNFLSHGAIYTTALDMQGKKLWQEKINDYTLHQGFSSSPALFGPLVIVSADNKGGTGVLAGLNRATGKIVWSHARPALPNYPSPIILNVGGKEQMFLTGCDLVTSLDPSSGSLNWEFPGATTECVTSTVTDGTHIYTSGGYPKNHLAAVKADGSGTVAWESPARVYVPSMVLQDGYLYAMLDAGVAQCWKSDTGQEMWKQRIGGTFSSSLVLVDGAIYATDEAGKTTIFKASPKGYELVGENQLGGIAFATPVIIGSRIYHRVAETVDGERREMLYCIE